MPAISQTLSDLDAHLLPHYPWLICILICLSIYFYRASFNSSHSGGPPPPYSLYLPSYSQLPTHYQASASSPPSSPPFSSTGSYFDTSKPHPIFHTFAFPPRRASKDSKGPLSPRQFPPRRKHSRKWSTGKEFIAGMEEVLEEGEDHSDQIVEIGYKSEKRESRCWSGTGMGKRSISA